MIDSTRELSRIRWRCRRGTKELDVVLGRFVDQEYAGLSRAERALFSDLLEIEDPVLTEWLCFNIKPEDQGMSRIVERILSTAGG